MKRFVKKKTYIKKNNTVNTVQQRTPLWPGFNNTLNENVVIRVE